MEDDNKSIMSQSSTLSLNSSHGEAFSKTDEVIFTLFYPLYDQEKKPGQEWPVILWVVQFIQLFALAFFRTDPETYHPTAISYVLYFF